MSQYTQMTIARLNTPPKRSIDSNQQHVNYRFHLRNLFQQLRSCHYLPNAGNRFILARKSPRRVGLVFLKSTCQRERCIQLLFPRLIWNMLFQAAPISGLILECQTNNQLNSLAIPAKGYSMQNGLCWNIKKEDIIKASCVTDCLKTEGILKLK